MMSSFTKLPYNFAPYKSCSARNEDFHRRNLSQASRLSSFCSFAFLERNKGEAGTTILVCRQFRQFRAHEFDQRFHRLAVKLKPAASVAEQFR